MAAIRVFNTHLRRRENVYIARAKPDAEHRSPKTQPRTWEASHADASVVLVGLTPPTSLRRSTRRRLQCSGGLTFGNRPSFDERPTR
jgi:hypothetical protein